MQNWETWSSQIAYDLPLDEFTTLAYFPFAKEDAVLLKAKQCFETCLKQSKENVFVEKVCVFELRLKFYSLIRNRICANHHATNGFVAQAV